MTKLIVQNDIPIRPGDVVEVVQVGDTVTVKLVYRPAPAPPALGISVSDGIKSVDKVGG